MPKPLKYLFAFFVITGLCLGKQELGATNSPLKLEIRVDGDRVDFRLKNEGKTSIAYHDAWNQHLGLPGGAWIEAKERNGNLITQTEMSPTGRWSPLVFSSEATVVPVEKLSSLESGQSRQASGSIGTSLKALKQVKAYQNPPVAVRIGCSVYTDRDLKTAVSRQTPWISYRSK